MIAHVLFDPRLPQGRLHHRADPADPDGPGRGPLTWYPRNTPRRTRVGAPRHPCREETPVRRHPDRPLTPEENRARNIARLLNPPRPTLADRYHQLAFTIEEWWGRHISQRHLYRLLDSMRLPDRDEIPSEEPSPDYPYGYGLWPEGDR